MATSNVTWICRHFEQLTPAELYALLRLRSKVFVVEQQCIYLDMDDKDLHAWHVMGYINDELIATTRLLPKGISYPDYISIGRVVNSEKLRGTGIGFELMQQSIDHCKAIFGDQPIKIGAQLYLKKFYESLGFRQVSEVYDEDGIDHIKMLREVDTG